MDADRIADLAEELVSGWATAAGFTVTRVGRDRRGWDQFFEFSAPRPETHTGPLGLPTLDFSAKVQVKATRASSCRVPVKLSNWKRAIEDVLPWFFLLVRFDARGTTVAEVAVVHVGQVLTEKVLRRLYHLPQAARSAIHKHVMDLTWKTEDLIAEPFPEALRTRLSAAIGRDPFAYAKQKQSWYENAGKGESTFTVHFRADTPEQLYRRLARAAVGLDGPLEVAEFTATTTRFGIKEPDTRFGLAEGGRLQIGPSKGTPDVSLIVSRADGLQAVTLRGPLQFSAAVFPMLPREFWILRLATSLLDVVLDVGAGNFNARLALPADGDKIPIRALATAFSFFQLLDESRGEQLLFQVERDRRTVPLGTLLSGRDLHPEFVRLTRLVSTVWSLVRDLGADVDANFSLEDIERLGPVAQIMLEARKQGACQLLLEAVVPSAHIEVSEPVTLVTNPVLRIGSLVYGEIVTFSGSGRVLAEEAGKARIRVESSSLRTLRSLRLTTAQVASFAWDELLKSLAQTLEEQGKRNVFILPWRTTDEPA